MSDIILYDYWRSSASYRVRIALNIKGLDYEVVPVNLLERAHKTAEHLKRHPQGIVPAIEIDGIILNQSLAIIEYLDETRPQHPLLPKGTVARARVREMAQAIAMEIHPVCNLSVVAHVMALSNGDEDAKHAWMQKYISSGLAAFEARLDGQSRYCHGDMLTMADCCLIPQIYNAQRWGADYSRLKNIRRIEENCRKLEAFKKAWPEYCKPA